MAVCKPRIRSTCSIGDWIIGVSAKSHGVRRLLFVFRVDEKLTYRQYWSDRRFRDRRPTGVHDHADNRYRPAHPTAAYPYDVRQVPSQHAFIDLSGRVVQSWYNFHSDMSGKFVLVSQQFWYFGAQPLEIRHARVRKALRMDTLQQGHVLAPVSALGQLVRLLPQPGIHGGWPTPISPRVWGYLGFVAKPYNQEKMRRIAAAHTFLDCENNFLPRVDVKAQQRDRGHLLYKQGVPTPEFEVLLAQMARGKPGLRAWLPVVRGLRDSAVREGEQRGEEQRGEEQRGRQQRGGGRGREEQRESSAGGTGQYLKASPVSKRPATGR